MQRRTKALLLIVFGVLVIVAVLVWFLWPWKQQLSNPAPQPPGYQEPLPTEPLPVQPAPAPVIADPSLLEARRLEDKLRRFAEEFASRAGTYSNTDDFAALRDAGLEGTAQVRTFLAAERTRLTAAYPLRTGTWGQTARGLASKITSPTPIRDQQEVQVQVDVQVVTESGDSAPVTSYRKANLTLQRTGTVWGVARLVWVEDQP